MIDAAATIDQNIVLHADGTLSAWGDDFYGVVSGAAAVTEAVAVEGGLYYALALRADGTVAAFGRDNRGQVSGATGVTGAVAIAAGYEHAMALLADGSVVGLGRRHLRPGLGACRRSATYERSRPTATTAAALLDDGTVLVWGDDTCGQVSGGPRPRPRRCLSPSAVSTGWYSRASAGPATRRRAAGGHGLCRGDDSCQCDEGWAGAACDSCDTGWYPAGTCDTFCDAATTCRGAGTCDTDGSCLCDAGTWGPSCLPCPANGDGVCGGHGTCFTDTGACLCDARHLRRALRRLRAVPVRLGRRRIRGHGHRRRGG